MQRLNIAVAGAGVGGLAAAAFLARDGHSVDVFDRFETPSPVGAGLMLQETGLAILQALGLREAATRQGAPVACLLGLSALSGRPVLDVRYAALRPDLVGIGVKRSILFNLLLDAAKAAGARINCGCEVADVDSLGGSLIRHTGQALGPFDLIIDAMGARSPTNGPDDRLLPYGALWTTIDWPGGGFREDALEQRYLRARQMAGLMPSSRDATGKVDSATYFWSIRGDHHADFLSASLDRWKAGALSLWPETAAFLEVIDSHEAFAFARYRHRTVWPCFEDRLVRIGDAWHSTSPQLGQGANNALLDAYGLSLALRTHGDDRSAALNSYANMRSLHVRIFQTMSHLLTPVYQSDGVVLPFLRDWIAGAVMQVPPAPQMLAALVSGAVGRPLRAMGLA